MVYSREPVQQVGAADSGRAWRFQLIIGMALAVGYFALPYGLFSSSVYIAAGVLATAAITLAVLRRRLFSPVSWIVLAGGLALCSVGNFIWYWLDLQGLSPFPSAADIFYLGASPLFALSLWLLADHNYRDDGALSDAVIVGISAAVLCWVLLIEPYVNDPSLTLDQVLVSAAYPVVDMILLPLVLRLVFMLRTRIVAHKMLLAGWSSYLAADILYAYGNSMGWYSPGGVVDSLWLFAYALFAAAAWHPSATVEPGANTSAADLSSRRIFILGTAAVLVPSVILFSNGSNDDIVPVAAVASILIFVLVMLRMAGLLKQTHRQAEALESLSRTDPLTGAANRRHFDHELAREMARAERTCTPLCLAFVDIDHFKRFNDTNGHQAGDALLEELVAVWQRALRPVDLLARIGGEEFVVVFPDTRIEQCQAILERLREFVPYQQTCSAGLAAYRSGESAEAFLQRADEALYVAKNSGRNRVVYAGECRRICDTPEAAAV